MDTRTTTLLVIGGGPGGYVAAIRAAQLGIATTLVEGDKLGGTCLNIGCIPSKALIHAAEQFEHARHYAQDSPLGIRVESPRIDLAQTVRWKDGIVARLTGGVGSLLKKNGVQVIAGWARIVDGKTVEVAAGAGQRRAAHRLRTPVARPRLGGGGAAGDAVRRARHLVDRSARAARAAEASGRRRRRLHRTGARHRVPQAGRRGDGGRGAGPRAAGLRRRARQARGPFAAPARRASCIWVARCRG